MDSFIPSLTDPIPGLLRFVCLNVLATAVIVHTESVQSVPPVYRISPLVCLYEVVACWTDWCFVDDDPPSQAGSDHTMSEREAPLSGLDDGGHRMRRLGGQIGHVLLLLLGSISAVMLLSLPGDMPWTRSFAAICLLHLATGTVHAERPALLRNAPHGAKSVWTGTMFSIIGHIYVCAMTLSPSVTSHWLTFTLGLVGMGVLGLRISLRRDSFSSNYGIALPSTFAKLIFEVCGYHMTILMSIVLLSDMTDISLSTTAANVVVVDVAVLSLLIMLAPSRHYNFADATIFATCTWATGLVTYGMLSASSH